ncbi:MAG: VanZ family protein [Proteobacteria bacterium]|nr:VanZ family protein [Pseudomonadota bacterium]MBU4295055.1 VanZ family protein [Pseudomonadota bacterium]MCG2746593.1 VanZ family protein [Desulfobulbaceae bacterium]
MLGALRLPAMAFWLRVPINKQLSPDKPVEERPGSGSILRVLPMIGMMAAILVAASVPGIYLPFLRHHNLDKICHGLAYAALAASCLFAFQPLFKKHPFLASLLVVAICLGYGFAEEAYQSLIPRRVTDSRDVMADLLGATIVVVGRQLGLLRKKPD